MQVAILGLGEAGTLYAAGFAAAGVELTGFDPADVPTPGGVRRCADIAEAVRDAELVLGLTGAKHALAVLQQAAPAMRTGACFADMNSGSPALKARLAEALDTRGDLLIAAVPVSAWCPARGGATALVVPARGGGVVRAPSAPRGARVDVVGARPGDAARRKLLRSMFMKSL